VVHVSTHDGGSHTAANWGKVARLIMSEASWQPAR
jgi:hypothetical protein